MSEFRYFSSVEGRAFRRPGTASYIGATRTASGYVWNTKKVVRIPYSEMIPHLKTYLNALRHGDIEKRTEADFEASRKPTPVPKRVKKRKATPPPAEPEVEPVEHPVEDD